MKPRDLAFLILINLIWGVNVVPIKLAVDAGSPIALAFARFLLVLLICLPWLRWEPGKMRAVVLISLVSGALQFSLNFLSFSMATNVSALAIAGQLSVPFSLLLAIAFLGERIRWIRTLGILLTFAGVLVLTFDPHVFDQRAALSVAIAATVAYSVGTILMRKLGGIHPLNFQAWLALLSLAPLAALSAWFEPGGLAQLTDLPLWVWGCILYISLGASVIGHAGIYYLLQRYPVTTIAPLTLLSPPIAVIASVALLGDKVTPQMVIGGCITLAGVAVITLRTAQKQSESASTHGS
jgi:O-acetylserine/cysteine efflux transporter